ncbi:nitroreductase/quinone reductase family protein [Pseudonocardia humida]|uniref:Nitroreductase family deazaflavin-dependent oxidoreductase n=1 Tax=Pseudonocardia humida TaxID=2800819 RepID=A0ABT0ZX29_9PSEU|nr:nitroreductase/quinone reductase family protein [Pseudonocardia humida]MCO1655297.1 nitroreductase family deazaflavin-dependent oxidoreductase [Pseudonocardia humida]
MDFNQPVIDEFRANAGVVGGMFEGARLLLLTTTGARTGNEHTVPLGYLPDRDGRVLVIGSAGGSPRHPAWFHNLVADPRVHVEAGVFRYPADAVVLTGAEREQTFARVVEDDPAWGDYQEKAGRLLPVVALVEVPVGPPDIAAPSPGAALRLVHDGFRRELALVRAEVARSGPGLGAQLRINCLALCDGLGVHHRNEDAAMFPALARMRPDLTDAVERLADEHARIAALLDELRAVLAEPDRDRAALLADIDRLTGEVEAHLDYEEQQLVPVLDGMAAGG